MSELLNVICKESVSIDLTGDYDINLLNVDCHTPTFNFITLLSSFMLLLLIIKPRQVTPTTSTLTDNIYTNGSNYSNWSSGIFCADMTDLYCVFCIENSKFPIPQAM